jgi:DNA-binding LacI/PurR family transcriptional regulator
VQAIRLLSALQAALKSGCTVPQEIGIIGVGNHRYGEYVRVPLSTVDQKQTEIGEKGASLLLDFIRQKTTQLTGSFSSSRNSSFGNRVGNQLATSPSV